LNKIYSIVNITKTAWKKETNKTITLIAKLYKQLMQESLAVAINLNMNGGIISVKGNLSS